MILTIQNLLAPQELSGVLDISKRAKFIDGRISNPHNPTKNNRQMDLTSSDYSQSSQIIGQALQRSPEFQRYAFPKRFAPPMLCKYGPGMAYGIHCDNAYVGTPVGPMRSDVSCTVYLADPASYAGGELRIHLGDMFIDVKLSPGDAVVYPSTTIHEVMPVTNGERIVAITFIESNIAGPAERELLYTLGEIAALEGGHMEWTNRVQLEKVRHNLHRMWSS